MTGNTRGGKYPDELPQGGVRMVFEIKTSTVAVEAIESISKKLGVNHETLRK